MRLIRILLLLCLTLASTARAEPAILTIGTLKVQAEIADTDQARQRGLMHRTRLCPNCGMLFIFEKAGRYDFWMKNTPLPLSIAFIAADGNIINIEEMQPKAVARHSAQGAALYALEMNSGWFRKHGVVAGRKVQGLPAARQPVTEQGN
jgi:uncharacterized membrane protein (UPF0127 family)